MPPLDACNRLPVIVIYFWKSKSEAQSDDVEVLCFSSESLRRPALASLATVEHAPSRLEAKSQVCSQ